MRLDDGPFADVSGFTAFENGCDPVVSFANQFFRIADIDEAAGYDIGAGQRMAGALGQSHDDDDDAFHGQLLAVADNDVADVADTEAVDEDAAGVDMARLMTGAIGKLKDLPIVANEDVILIDAHHDG